MFELKEGLPERQYCDDRFFEFFEGNFLNPEKYLQNQNDIESINHARNLILTYFKVLEENHLLES